MSELKDRIKSDLTTAMKARDKVRTATLRMVLASIATEESSGSSRSVLSDEEVTRLLVRETKKRREAAEAFDAGGRPDDAANERAESEVISDYLPQPLTDAELTELVEAAIAETGASGMKEMGKVMKVLNPRIAGRADGARVAAEVKGRLG
ncbi:MULTISPECIES: GatB/YqeY domain-containing protein [Nocardiopsis]|uniref:GatB/YqeY domain-containing protein n=2 Tax=Nocardiopsis alba TaxID=53437 RepID=A0A7K2ISA9_9ACTN|nr:MULTISPECIES: GatB/YqeY domain-containing protein [Nocardiopsis]AFR10334.1 yqey-like family protein [Nocardiopsis alba ATCC BAA-2165]MEC3895814.1 GatB/YqeY domain-containing protein [Nocardiopsis sp. LDBS1602]MYR32803.1 GatB/YqeY domain-containing protein [Nocardiopsis alba]